MTVPTLLFSTCLQPIPSGIASKLSYRAFVQTHSLTVLPRRASVSPGTRTASAVRVAIPCDTATIVSATGMISFSADTTPVDRGDVSARVKAISPVTGSGTADTGTVPAGTGAIRSGTGSVPSI